MWFTFKHMFKPNITLEYPEKKVILGSEFRGRPVLVSENDTERCVACGLCARICPPLAISMQADETTNVKERFPKIFEIDMLRCIYCGLCEEVCPEEAIVMSQEYDLNFRDRKDAKFGKDKLLVDKAKLHGRLEFLKKFRNQNYGTVYDFSKENNQHSIKDQVHH
jgi:NADH-quinone oxidoreductase subunit I